MTARTPRRTLTALLRAAPLSGGILLCVLTVVAARVIRYRVVEPDTMGAICADGGPAWCPLRTGLIVLTEWHAFAWLALVAALLALISAIAGAGTGTRLFAAVALVTGGFGMVLYNTTLAVPAVVLALICLAWRR